MEDDSVALSPPRSLRFDINHEFQTEILDGEYVWAGPVDAWPARMHGVFSVYFPEPCSSRNMIKLGVAAATGEPLLLVVVLGPESVTVWSDEPGSFEQPWYEPLNLPLNEWIDVQISIDFADESATLRIGDDTTTFPTLWEIAVGFQIAEVHAGFGTGIGFKSSVDCTYHMDNVAFVLE